MIDVRVMPPREILTSQRGTDGRWHAHYPTASQTLCGRDVTVFKIGRKWPPDCGVCGKTARAYDRIDASMPAAWRPDAPEPEAAAA